MDTAPLIRIQTAHKHAVHSVAFSPCGQLLATGGGYRDNSIRIWETAAWNPTQVLRGHKGRINSLSFSPDGKRIASASEDKTVRLWEVATGQTQGIERHSTTASSVAFSPTGRELASCDRDGFVRVTAVDTFAERRRLGPHAGSVVAVRYSPDGTSIASAGGLERSKDFVCLWDARTGQRIATLDGHSDLVLDVSWSPDGKWLASLSYSELLLRDATSMETISKINNTDWSMICFAFSPEGTFLICGGSRYPQDFSGRLDYQRAEGGIQVWSALTATLRHEFVAHNREISCLGVSKDGATLASGSRDGTVKIWNVSRFLHT